LETQTGLSPLAHTSFVCSILQLPSSRQELDPDLLPNLEARGFKSEIIRLIHPGRETVATSQKESGLREYSVGYQWNQVKMALFGLCLCKATKVILVSGGITLSAHLLESMILLARSNSADVVIASRFNSGTMAQYPMHQRVLSRLFRKASRLAVSNQITDPRSGVKLFDRRILLNVLSRIVASSSDLHLLPLAYFRHSRIAEVPAPVQSGSSRYPLNRRVLWNALSDLARASFRRNL